jgi:hypothetical protein
VTPEQVGTFLREYGLPMLVVVLLVFEVLVPRGRLRREESRADKAMDIAEGQVEATKELTGAVKQSDTRLGSIEQRLDRIERRER